MTGSLSDPAHHSRSSQNEFRACRCDTENSDLRWDIEGWSLLIGYNGVIYPM